MPEKWWAAFELPGRTGAVAVQYAGAVGCPSVSIYPCPCRDDLNYHVLEAGCV